jgi:hypothetical protein
LQRRVFGGESKVQFFRKERQNYCIRLAALDGYEKNTRMVGMFILNLHSHKSLYGDDTDTLETNVATTSVVAMTTVT